MQKNKAMTHYKPLPIDCKNNGFPVLNGGQVAMPNFQTNVIVATVSKRGNYVMEVYLGTFHGQGILDNSLNTQL